jgi:hypothetical protein
MPRKHKPLFGQSLIGSQLPLSQQVPRYLNHDPHPEVPFNHEFEPLPSRGEAAAFVFAAALLWFLLWVLYRAFG